MPPLQAWQLRSGPRRSDHVAAKGADRVALRIVQPEHVDVERDLLSRVFDRGVARRWGRDRRSASAKDNALGTGRNLELAAVSDVRV
jgi:hypothetical protein